jgi:hypothetical protein
MRPKRPPPGRKIAELDPYCVTTVAVGASFVPLPSIELFLNETIFPRDANNPPYYM